MKQSTLMILLIATATLMAGLATAAEGPAPTSTSPSALSQGADPRELIAQPSTVEIRELRTETSKTWQLSDGSLLERLSTAPLHYQSPSGEWLDINTDFVARGTIWRNDENTFSTTIGAAGSMSLYKGTATLRATPTSIAALGAGSVVLESTTPRTASASISGPVVSLHGLYPGAIARYTSDFGVVRQDLILTASPYTNTTAESFAVVQDIALPAGSIVVADGTRKLSDFDTDGGIFILDSVGTPTFTIYSALANDALYPAGLLTDATASSEVRGSYHVEFTPGGFRLYEKIPMAWLNSPTRQFPVTIDPTFGWERYSPTSGHPGQAATGTKCRQDGTYCGSNYQGDTQVTIGNKEDAFGAGGCLCQPDVRYRHNMKMSLAAPWFSDKTYRADTVLQDEFIRAAIGSASYDVSVAQTDSWTQSGVTWNNQPTPVWGAASATVSTANINQWVRWTLDALIFQHQLQTDKYGWETASNGAHDDVLTTIVKWPGECTNGCDANTYFTTDRTGANSPGLWVSYSSDPNAPTSAASPQPITTNNGWSTSAISVTGSCSDSESGCHAIQTWTNMDGTTLSGETSQTRSINVDGKWNYQMRSEDNVKNWGSWTSPLVYKLDTTNPTLNTATVPGTVPASGWYTNPVTVSLSASDGQSGIQKIFYRWGTSGTWSSISGTLDVTGTVSGTTPAFGTDGTHTFQYYTVDWAGRTTPTGGASSPSSLTVKIDTTDPTVSSSISPANPNAQGWYTTGITLSASYGTAGSGSPITSRTYEIKCGTTTVASGTWPGDTAVSNDCSSYTANFVITDESGRTGTSQKTFKIDQSAPTLNPVTFDKTPNTAGWYKQSPTATLKGADSVSGMMKVEYKRPWDSSFQSTNGDTANAFINQDGTSDGVGHLIQWKVTNGAGLVTTGSSFNVKVDTTNPTTLIQSISPSPVNGWNQGTVQVTLTRSDAMSGIFKTYYKLGAGGAQNDYTGQFPVSGEGTTRVYYWSEDNAGNVEPNTNNWRDIMIDTVNPEATATVSPASPNGNNNWYRGVTVTGAATCSDATPPSGSGCSTIQYRWDTTSSYTPYNDASKPTKTPDGHWNFQTLVTDVSQRTGSASKTFDIDSTPPVLTSSLLGQLGDNQWYNNAVTLTASQTDALSTPDIIQVGPGPGCTGPWTTYDPNARPNFPNNGIYSRCVRGTDKAGNEDTDVWDFRVDDTDPVSTLTFVSGTQGGSWYSTPVCMRLDAVDNAQATESDVASVAYRILQNGNVALDWTTTTAGSQVCFSYDGVNKIELRAKDKAGNVGPVVSATFSIDIVAPGTTLTITPAPAPSANGWIAGCAHPTLTATDPGSGVQSMSWRLNGGTWTNVPGSGGPTLVATLPDVCTTSSTHSIDHTATDVAGNVETIQPSPFKVDMEAPTCVVSINGGVIGGDGWYTTAPMASITGADAAGGSGVVSLKYRILTNGAENPGWTTIPVGGGSVALPEGRNVVECQSFDLAGYASTIGSGSGNVDRTPPATTPIWSGTVGTNNWYTTCAGIVFMSVDDLSGVKEIRYRVTPGGVWTVYTQRIDLCQDGSWTVEYYAIDKAGNVESTKSFVTKVDQTKPHTQIDQIAGTHGDGVWYTTDVSITVSCTDATSLCHHIETQTDAGGWPTYTNPVLVAGDAVHTFRHRGVDNAGNVENYGEISVSIDKLPPVTSHSLAGPLGNAGWYTGTVTVTLSASDATSGVKKTEYELDGGPATTYLAPFPVTPDGTHSFRYRSQDNAGNWEAWSSLKPFQIDSTPPVSTATILSGTIIGNGWREGIVDVGITCTDAVTGITTSGCSTTEYYIDNPPYLPYSGPVRVGDGNHVLHYRSKDVAGNVESDRQIQVKVDNDPPVTVRSIIGKYWNDGGKTWVGRATLIQLTGVDTASGVQDTFYKVDNEPWQTYSTPFSLHPRSGGQHTVTAYSIDNSGHVEAPPRSWTFWYDNAAPTVTYKAPPTDGVVVYDVMVLTTSPWKVKASTAEKDLPQAPPVSTGGATVVGGGATFDVEAKDGASETAVDTVTWFVSGSDLAAETDYGPSANDRYTFWWEPNVAVAIDYDIKALACDKVGNCAEVVKRVTAVPLLNPGPPVTGEQPTSATFNANMKSLVDGMVQCIPSRDEAWQTQGALVPPVLVNCVYGIVQSLPQESP